MPPKKQIIKPKTFYLNEQHELPHEAKGGGGQLPNYIPIDWAAKGRTINQSIVSAKDKYSTSEDPLRNDHYFLLSKPEEKVAKYRTIKGETEEYEDEIDFSAKKDAQIFSKLGLDLLLVNDDGTAVVHAKPERLSQIISTTSSLDEAGRREQFRWAKIQSFGLIPQQLRIDEGWIEELNPKIAHDAVIEFQPLLARSEIDKVIYAIKDILDRVNIGGLKTTGTDFSGRQWIRGLIPPEVLRKIAATFFSVQSLHSPLWAIAATPQMRGRERPPNTAQIPSPVKQDNLPCVAVLEGGVPDNHPQLRQYRRGKYTDPDSSAFPNISHGSLVASRVVFGDILTPPTVSLQGDCSFYDVIVTEDSDHIGEKRVIPAMEGVIANAPDVRVFNLSFDGILSFAEYEPVMRQNKLSLVQDLDNLIFAKDIIAVIAAGNSPESTTPNNPYPNHFDDLRWQLSHWARSFNSLTCGSFVSQLSAGDDVLVTQIGWPSPFTRVGPGLVNSPKPDFSAPGGNSTKAYTFRYGLGVWGLNERGLWEDWSGTSFAAPILAREAALAVEYLQGFCKQGARPYGATVKAFLELTVTPPVSDAQVEKLVQRSLGRGSASHIRLSNPFENTAIMLWQGVLESPGDKAMIRIPIPRQWMESANSPFLRLVIAWDTPVNAAIHNVWACRKVEAQLRAHPDSKTLYPKYKRYKSYPIIDRRYDLKKVKKITGDMWLLEISYKEIADYYPAITFDPQQRVGLAAELYDASDTPISPQGFVQVLPVASTMNRLSIPPVVMRTPIVLRTQV